MTPLMRTIIVTLLAFAIAGLPASAQEKGKATAKRAGKAGQRPVKQTPDFANVKYGPHDATVLDLWLAKSDQPTPILINIHGGGFRAGTKSNYNAALLDHCLKAGISFASVEYRLTDVAQYPAQMHDCARAVQFLRANAKKWNLDPKRFAATGGSAGAGISVWLAFHDDLANPKSDDPVLRESTRLTCALVTALQSTYDPREIKKIVPGNAYDISAIKVLFGVPVSFNWDTDKISPDLDARLKDGAPVNHLTKDDAPVYVVHDARNNVSGNIHHANFGKYLKERMDKTGLECVTHMDTDFPGGYGEQTKDMFEWMNKHFRK
jgi:acetyl esterase